MSNLFPGGNVLQLILNSAQSAEPVVPVRWCVTPTLVETLKKEGAANPHIFFSIHRVTRSSNKNYAPLNEEVDRRCVPLEQAMDYIDFTHAGEHLIYAYLFWGPSSSVAKFRKWLLAKTSRWGGFDNEPCMEDRSDKRSFVTSRFNSTLVRGLPDALAEVEVNIEPEFFAHEPPEWERQWVNLLFKYEPRDQCEYRKRRIVAYTVQPLAVLLWTTFNTLVRVLLGAVLLLLGVRGINFHPILHPFDGSIDEMWTDVGDNERGRWRGYGFWHSRNHFFSTDSKGNTRPFGFWFLHPMHLVVTAVVLGLLYVIPYWMYENVSIFAWLTAIASLAMASIATLFYLLAKFIDSTTVVKVLKLLELRWGKRSDDVSLDKIQAYYETGLDDVLCGMGKNDPSISALRRPSVTLLFKATKAAVCRPYIAR